MSSLREKIVLLFAVAVDGIIEAVEKDFGVDLSTDNSEGQDELDAFFDELFDDDDSDWDEGFFDDDTDSIGQTEVKPDLWANPPEPAASWPNVNKVPSYRSTWPNVQSAPTAAPAASWPNVQTVGGGVDASTMAKPKVAVQPFTRAAKPAVIRETVERDGRRRACVPNAMVEAVGIKAFHAAYIARRAHGAPGLVILKSPAGSGHISTYTVDKDSNIRLSEWLLAQGGLDASAKIKFRTSNSHDSILVLAG